MSSGYSVDGARRYAARRLPAWRFLLGSALALAMLSGCALGPDYRRPDVTTPAAFKEAGDWKAAEPQDLAARGNWWEVYGDGELNGLVSQIQVSNQNVAAAVAQYRQAQALVDNAQAGYWPTLGSNLSGSRAQSAAPANGGSGNSGPVVNTVSAALSASWEVDLWGRISRSVEANEATAQASEADLRAALLSAQATLVQNYLQLRVNDAQRQLLDQTIAAYQRSLQITQNRYEAGVVGRVDVAQAETQLKATQAQAVDLSVNRAQLEHAIAVQIGKAPADFSLPPANALPQLPNLPPLLAASLLERRPDIAAAERRMAAANAQIGVTQAAFFPALNFTANGGYQNNSLVQLLTLPNRFWSVGPALALTLFDGGARAAQKHAAEAAYDKTVASYRQTVLAAFQEVEDQLAALHWLGEEAGIQQAATRSAEEALQLTENQYQAGTVSYLNVVTAQATALSAQRNRLDLIGRRLIAYAALQKALGGGWQTQ